MAALSQRRFVPVSVSLRDLLGAQYIVAVARGHALLHGSDEGAAVELACRAVDLLPESFQQQQVRLLEKVGQQIAEPLADSAGGATTAKYAAATRKAMAPVSTAGMFRLAEDGRLHLITKAEHYHVSLGHGFPGWRLLEHARQLGIPNATHNNTRGHVTRLLEEQLVAAVGAGGSGLDRVLNLETGSLALEAAIKIVLARFYRAQVDSPEPKYEGRVPVLLVMADEEGDITAGYHGTTLIAQTMRGMWPAIRHSAEKHGIYRVRAIRPNNIADLEHVFREDDSGHTKIAGFFFELILMNYGATALRLEFVQRLQTLCEQHDVPMIIDEIQTGLWSPRLFMFREYGLKPAMIGLGKGFPGGEYAASRLIFSGELDLLPQFGALVTNGQEEIASLAYLVAMRWAVANAEVTSAIGEYFEERIREVADGHRALVKGVDGRRQLLGIQFYDVSAARAFTKEAEALGLDISVQTYKTSIPPAALTKLPLTAPPEAVDLVAQKLNAALASVEKQGSGVA